MKCLAIGICQLEALTTILKQIPGFTDTYTEIVEKVIFLISEEEIQRVLDEVVPEMDLVLSQPVSRNYRDNEIFSSHTLRAAVTAAGGKHYIIANCYCTVYDPLPFQTTDINGNINSYELISYFPAISFFSLLPDVWPDGNEDGNSLQEDKVKQAAIDWCNIDAYVPATILRNVMRTMEELKSREKKVFEEDFPVDITISDFIEKHYRELYLFHTYNHPTNLLLIELAKKLCTKLNIEFVSPNLSRELLGLDSLPPCPSVYYHLKMSFPYPKIIIGGFEYETLPAMTKYCKVLSKVKDEPLIQKWKDCIAWKKSLLE